jgi:hypothetical protein
MHRRLFLCIALTGVILAAAALITEPSAGNALFGATTTLASMMLIGDIPDVSDRDTHGSDITYQVYLVSVKQIDRTVAFPMPNANRELGSIPMQSGQYMKYFEAHDIPTYTATGEKGDITTSGENTFVIIMGGMRDQLLNFVEQYAGDKFVIIFKEIGTTQWYVIGSVDRPMILKSFEAKNDKDRRYVTFTFSRVSIDQYCKYAGNIATALPTTPTADATTLAITPPPKKKQRIRNPRRLRILRNRRRKRHHRHRQGPLHHPAWLRNRQPRNHRRRRLLHSRRRSHLDRQSRQLHHLPHPRRHHPRRSRRYPHPNRLNKNRNY